MGRRYSELELGTSSSAWLFGKIQRILCREAPSGLAEPRLDFFKQPQAEEYRKWPWGLMTFGCERNSKFSASYSVFLLFDVCVS